MTTIDLDSSRELKPNAEELLESLGLSSYATVIFEPTSYTWRLMKMIEEDPETRIDLCYIDGAPNWYEDGFAFFLADRLLRPGGWVVFDDLRWNYATSPSMKGTERVAKMPPDERETRQLRNVFDLLVKQHPSYGEFREKDGWGYARKLVEGATGRAGELRTQVIHEKEYVGLGAAILTIAKRLRRSF